MENYDIIGLIGYIKRLISVISYGVIMILLGAMELGKRILTTDKIRQSITEVSKKYGVKRVLLFGSYARGEVGTDSDIDLRIDKGEIKGLFQLSGYRLALEKELNIKVDIVTTESISEEFLRNIGKEEIVL
ncbi:MAG: nucleotidyltransferase domain-containing protein [Alkaliphilus sp.]|nr:nucleotidyltransferase domain-containing protein [Alkaliphilus sp.]